MKKKHVSIWLGRFTTKSDLKKYVELHYSKNEKRKQQSEFWKEYRISYHDEDFQEVTWKGKVDNIHGLLTKCSYSDSFVDEVEKQNISINIKDFTSAILMYDVKYNGRVLKGKTTQFLGVFEYQEDEDDLDQYFD